MRRCLSSLIDLCDLIGRVLLVVLAAVFAATLANQHKIKHKDRDPPHSEVCRERSNTGPVVRFLKSNNPARQETGRSYTQILQGNRRSRSWDKKRKLGYIPAEFALLND
ncbi:unnamed protein product [Linum trigynum]|uniref:Uncharacterized protein n=1 Tax=Linum trigynum TaxID=586398 RepID=A0AAV2FC01_9ROSI